MAVVLFGLLLAGCDQTEPKAIRFGLSTSVVTLDPRYASDATSNRLCRLIYQTLVDFDDHFEPVPALADWQAVAPTRYVFALRETPRFHDGSVLDSADVVATYRSVLDPTSASPHRGSLTNIKTLTALDERRIAIDLVRPDPMFPGLLVIGILPAERIGNSDSRSANVVGSGPFKVAGPWNDKRVELIRRVDERRFEFHTVKDATVRALKLAHGEIDIVQGGLAPEIVAWLERQDGVASFTVPGTTFTYIGFNLTDEFLGESSVRRALALAIDRDAIIEHLFAHKARPASAIFSPEHWASSESLQPLVYDPERARTLLERNGFGDDRPLSLTYKTSSDNFRLRIATVIQDQLAKVGVAVKIQSYDWGTFYGDIKAGRFQMYSLSWVGLKLPDMFRYVFHSESTPPGGANRGRYRSAVVDKLIEDGEALQRRDERRGVYQRIQARILADLPYVPLWYEDHVVVLRDDIQGYRVGLDGNYDALTTVSRKDWR